MHRKEKLIEEDLFADIKPTPHISFTQRAGKHLLFL